MQPLKFKIDATIFDSLREVANDLPERAPNGGHDNPAGLVLLGRKDGAVDTIVPLKMSGGCWDAPEISFKDMDIGLRKLIKNDNVCIGMALVRNPNWHSSYCSIREEVDSRISNDIRRHVHEFKNCFEDIEQTVWISLYKNYFRTYRAVLDEYKRIILRETSSKTIYDNTDKSEVFEIRRKKKADAVIRAKEERENKRKQREIWERRQKLIDIERRKQKEIEEHNQKLREIKDSIKINKDIKEKKKKKIDLGNGMVFILNGEGEYMLWQNK